MCFHGANPDGAYYLRGADGSLQGVVSRGSQGYTKNGEYKTAYRNYELAKNSYDDAEGSSDSTRKKSTRRSGNA